MHKIENKSLKVHFEFIGLLIVLTLFAGSKLVASVKKKKIDNELKYRTSFGKCPSRSTGNLTMKLVHEFERSNSLMDVKKEIVRKGLQEKYFLDKYSIKYRPQENTLYFKFDCPTPLMKVHVYKEDGSGAYSAILTENSELYDATYEVLLRKEGRIKNVLPSMALPVSNITKETRLLMTSLLEQMGTDFRSNLSELILSESNDLTVILSVNRSPTSVFMGDKDWEEKVDKLIRIISHMKKNSKVPAVINMTNLKKIVVKFSNKI